jgi:hypothetical protein
MVCHPYMVHVRTYVRTQWYSCDITVVTLKVRTYMVPWYVLKYHTKMVPCMVRTYTTCTNGTIGISTRYQWYTCTRTLVPLVHMYQVHDLKNDLYHWYQLANGIRVPVRTYPWYVVPYVRTYVHVYVPWYHVRTIMFCHNFVRTHTCTYITL